MAVCNMAKSTVVPFFVKLRNEAVFSNCNITLTSVYETVDIQCRQYLSLGLS